MPYKIVNCFMSAVLFLTAMLLFPPYPAMAADSATTQFNVPDAQPAHISDEIVLHFTNTASLKDADGNQTDPNITSICRPITADDVGMVAQRCSSTSLLRVGRLCDQVLLSVYDCILKYSHHDDNAMYWSVNTTGGDVSECTIYVLDNTSVLQVTLHLTPRAGHEDCTTSDVSTNSTEKLPGWAIAVIVVVAVIFIAIIVIALLCLCVRCLMGLRQRRSQDKEETADTAQVDGEADGNPSPSSPMDACISVSMGPPLVSSPPQATANVLAPPLPMPEEGHQPP